MAPALKITYFDFKGRAEPIRLALVVGGIEFEDTRLTAEEFQAIKPSLPYGQLPVMEVDGEVIAQGLGLLTYAGKLSGLLPEDPIKGLRVHEILGACEDFITFLRPIFFEQDEAKRQEMRKALAEDTLPRWFGQIEKRITGWGTQYAAADELTIADLSLYVQLGIIKDGVLVGVPTDIMNPFPKICEIMEKVGDHPKVKEWNAAH